MSRAPSPNESGPIELGHRHLGPDGEGAPSYMAVCAKDLRALAQVLFPQERADAHAELVEDLLFDWGSTAVPGQAPYPSNIGDDHSPFEYSVAFAQTRTELRLLFEAQAVPPSDEGNRRAALEFNQRLGERPGVDMQRFDQVRDLFVDGPGCHGFSLWHAVCLDPGRVPAFKLYMNPQARGSAEAQTLIREALLRLGLPEATMTYVARALRRHGLDQLSYFSLDLSDDAKSRVKIYVAHHAISPQELDEMFGICPNHRPGDVVDFCQSMGGPRQRFERKPLMSCLSFVGGSNQPSSMTLHLPIAHYVDSDEVALARVSSFLQAQGLDEQTYRSAVGAIAKRPLNRATGIQSYASYRRENGVLRLTVYLSPELFGAAGPAEP